MVVLFVARRFQPQVDQSLKVLPPRYALSARTAEQNRCDCIGWPQLRPAVFHLLDASGPKTSTISNLYADGKRHECAWTPVRQGHVYPGSSGRFVRLPGSANRLLVGRASSLATSRDALALSANRKIPQLGDGAHAAVGIDE